MKKIRMALLVLMFIFNIQPVFSAGDVTVGLTTSVAEVNPGGLITYNISYGNNSGEELSQVVVAMDLSLDGGLTFISSSYPVELTADNRPMWRLGTMAADEQSGIISLTISVNSDYSSDQIIASSSIDANKGSQLVSSSSGGTSVDFTTVSDDENEDEDSEEDAKDEEEEDDIELEEIEDEVETDLVATGANKLDIKGVAGGADLSQYENVNKWDGRLLTIGVVGFALILVVGLAAFFLGRKSG